MIDSRIILCALLASCFAVSTVFAQESTGSLEVFIKTANNDRISPEAITVKIYKDLETVPLKVIAPLESNPVTVSPLQTDHRYKVEVYMNNLYADVGFIDIKKPSERIEMTIKNPGGMRLNVFYKDGETPLANAMVWIKSQDGKSWFYSDTDKNGQTTRVWLYPTTKEGYYYYADISLGQNLLYTHSPIKLEAGIAQEFKIITKWPTIIDKLITVEVYNSTTNKVTKHDGTFVAQLYDIKKNKVAEAQVTEKGLAQFTKLKVNNYALYIKEKDASGQLHTVAGKKVTILESTDKIKVYLHNKELNDDHLHCNCVAFRLDDIQDYFLSPAQQAVISTFKDKDAQLTVGVIGGVTGTEQKLVSAIKDGVASGQIEIANHSWRHNIYTKMTKADQDADIKKTNEKILEVFGVTPKTFIPPENLFNNDTLSVLKENGFTHLSHGESGTVDIPPKFVKSNFYQFPMFAYTAKLNPATGFWQHETVDQTLEKINDSLFNYGYAVVMMHPSEFSSYENGAYANKVNMTKIGELGSLIDKIDAEGLRITTIGSIEDYDAPKVEAPVEVAKPDANCNCIAFRLDNVQDFWLSGVQNTVIDAFDEKNVPLTIAVIGKFVGDDSNVVGPIKQKLKDNPAGTKIANRGWEYLDHVGFDKEKQALSIKQTNDKIAKVFGVRSYIFAPPYDSFNKDTIDASSQNNILYLSSNVARTNPTNSFGALKSVPSTDSFVNLVDDDPFLTGTTRQKAMQKISSDIEQYGYALISLQPSDFAVKNDAFRDEVIAEKLDLLKSIISDAKSAGMKTVLLEQIPSLLDESVIVIPDWVKSNAGWWEEGKIGDSDFTKGLEYLIEQEIIKIPQTERGDGTVKSVPEWVKTNARWWADGKIGNSDFVRGIQYLIQNGIIVV